MADREGHTDLGSWLYLECLPPFMLVYLGLCFGLIGGPYTEANFLKHWKHSIATGEVAAVSFCLLLPVVIIAHRHNVRDALRGLVTLGAIGALCFYWAVKSNPVFDEIGRETVDDRHVVYGAVSILLTVFSIVSAYKVKQSAKEPPT